MKKWRNWNLEKNINNNSKYELIYSFFFFFIIRLNLSLIFILK